MHQGSDFLGDGVIANDGAVYFLARFVAERPQAQYFILVEAKVKVGGPVKAARLTLDVRAVNANLNPFVLYAANILDDLRYSP